MKNKFFSPVILPLIVLSFIFTSACSNKSSERPASKAQEVGYIVVSTQTVKLEQELAGRVVPSLIADVRPQVEGIIESLNFKEGQRVTAGQVLYKLNSETYRATYSQAVAALKSAESKIEAAQLRSERHAELAKHDGVSAQEADDAVAEYHQALATVEERRAQLETAKINLERTDIKAPISGHIGISNYTRGALVTANQTTPLAVIRSVDTVYVDMPQSVSQILRMRRMMYNNKNVKNGGTAVQLKLEDGTQYKHQGRLEILEIAVDENTGSVTLRAEFPNPEKLLLPGMHVKAVLKNAVNTNGITVKQQAVAWDLKGDAYVMVIDENNVARRRTVELGPSQEDKWIIFAGLTAGDKLIMEGLNRIKDGQTVNPVEMPKEGVSSVEK